MRGSVGGIVVALGAALAAGVAGPAMAQGGTTDRVSVGPGSRQADGGTTSAGDAHGCACQGACVPPSASIHLSTAASVLLPERLLRKPTPP